MKQQIIKILSLVYFFGVAFSVILHYICLSAFLVYVVIYPTAVKCSRDDGHLKCRNMSG
jgi:hypothetical protein